MFDLLTIIEQEPPGVEDLLYERWLAGFCWRTLTLRRLLYHNRTE